MTPTVRPANAARLLILMLALSLIALAILALACGPSAPAGQDRAPDQQSDSTSTPMPTQTPTRTAAATPTTDPNAAPMDDILKAWVAHHHAQQAVDRAATGSAAPEKTIKVQILVASPGQRKGIADFLESKGIAHSPVPGNHDIDATIPVSLAPQLAVFPGVQELLTKPRPYPSLGTYLNTLVAKYETGLMPGEDANPTYARLVIEVEGNDNYDAVVRFLKNNGATMAHSDPDIAVVYKPLSIVVAFVPVSKIAPLDRLEGVIQVWDEGYPVPEEHRFTEPPLSQPAYTPTPTAAAPKSQSGSDNVVGRPPTPRPAPAGAIAHGADHPTLTPTPTPKPTLTAPTDVAATGAPAR